MKKCLSCVLAAVILLTMAAVPALADDNEQFTQNGFTYAFLRSGNLKLVECAMKDETGEIRIPDTVNGHHVESIAEYAFEGCKMSKVTIPETVNTIAAFAFDNCTEIQRVSIPDSVTYIDGNPFTGCTKLVNIYVGPRHPTLFTMDGVLYSKRNKMMLCYPCSNTNLAYKVMEGIKRIGKTAFYGCDALVSVELPSTVTEIDEYAFQGCSNLKSISLPDSLLLIGEMAFSGCINLQSISIPAEISRIEVSTFFNCKSLAAVNLPEKLTDIAARAFYGCEKLKNVNLPVNVKSIGEKAFYGCRGLTDVYVPVTVTRIGDAAFDNCSPRLYLHISPYAFAEIYGNIYDVSVTFDQEEEYLKVE